MDTNYEQLEFPFAKDDEILQDWETEEAESEAEEAQVEADEKAQD